jgi:type I restriction enzyme S subunit
LDDIVNITSNKVDTKNLVLQQYISTENMLPDRKGISLAASMPLGKVNQFLKNDTLFSNIRTYFRKVWFSSFDGGSSPDVLIFRAKDVEVLDPRFLYYLISDQKFIDYSDKTSKGAKMPRGDKSAILNYKTYLPALSIQKRISQILSDLDDKIHLNNQINQTLESIAQAIFKSWFVDFEPVRAKITAKQTGQDPEFAAMCAISGKSEAELEQMAKEDFAELQATAALFPDELIESELGEVPKGWEVSNFKGFCKKIESGGTPKRSELHYWNGEIRWLSSGEVRETVVLDTKEKITKTGLLNSSAKLWEKYTTVIAMYGATAGQVCLLANEMAANQACCGLIPKDEFKSFAFLIARNSVRSLSDKASGSAQQNLNKGIIENQPCVLPRLSVARNFENLVFPLLRKWLANSEENIRLSVIRDSLLPKLLSGEVDVSGLQDEGIDG